MKIPFKSEHMNNDFEDNVRYLSTTLTSVQLSGTLIFLFNIFPLVASARRSLIILMLCVMSATVPCGDDNDDQVLSDEILNLLEVDYDFYAESVVSVDVPNIPHTRLDSMDDSDLSVDSDPHPPKVNYYQQGDPRPKAARKYVELVREQDQERKRALYQELEVTSKVAKLETPSRSVLNDVRRYYAKMFMNCVNSGDLPQVESYFSTFMSGPCNFVLKHNISPVFGIPPHLAAYGPRLFTHYLLGCFVTMPDMVLKLNSSRIITTKGWAGTKIVMETDVFCSKIYDLDYCWTPQADQLSDMYRNLRISDKPTLYNDSHHATYRTNRSNTAYRNGAGPVSTGVSIKTEPSTGSMQYTNSNTNYFTNSNTTTTSTNTYTSAPNIATMALSGPTTIPTTYVESLIERATLLRVPLKLNSKGTITLFLDENHCMQHVVVELTQVNVSTASFVNP